MLAEDALGAAGELLAGVGVGGGCEFGDVGAGGEGLAAGAAEQDGANGRVVGEGGEDGVELTQHVGVEGVEDLGAVEGDGGDGSVDVDEQRCFVRSWCGSARGCEGCTL